MRSNILDRVAAYLLSFLCLYRYKKETEGNGYSVEGGGQMD